MTKEYGGERREEEYEGQGGENEREECNVISCATEPHSRHGGNSR